MAVPSMKRILMFVYNNLSKDARVQRAAKELAKISNLSVVSYGGNTILTEGYNNVVIRISQTTNIRKYFEFVWKLIKFSYENKNYEIIYAHDFYSALPAIIMKSLNISKKMIYDAHELYVPSNEDKFSMREYFFYFFEKIAIKRADLVICAQEKRGEIMQRHFKLKRSPLVIRNISYLPKGNEFEETLQGKLDDFFSIKAITVVYAGVISPERKIESLVDAMNKLGHGYKLLIIGSGDAEKNLVNAINKAENKQILMVGSVPYNQLASILYKCDIGYLTYPPHGINNIYCAPNKMFEYASVGIAMVAPYNPTIKTEFEKYKIGICDDDIVNAIQHVAENLDEYKSNLKKLLQLNSWEKEASKLLVHVEKLIGK